MMYSNKLAIAIKVDGKVLREFDKDKVYLPFGKEFSILIKNLHTQRVVVNVNIDGNEAVKGGLVINSNSECELERWVKEDLNEGNRFKFIERTGNIENHRGINIEDGLVQIEYQFEQEPISLYNNRDVYRKGLGWDISWPYNSSCGISNNFTATHSYSASVNSVRSFVPTQNETGITVPGSISTQSFNQAYVGALEHTKHSMVLHLLGETENNQYVRQPVTVKAKPKCVTCGLVNKASSKFCNEFGTALKICA